MLMGKTATGSMWHVIRHGVLACDNRKAPTETRDFTSTPHMYCNLCYRVVGKPLRERGIWYYQI